MIRTPTVETAVEAAALSMPIHVNVPWAQLPTSLDELISLGLNPEIGFSGQDLDELCSPHSSIQLRTVARQLQERSCHVTLHGPFWDLNPGSHDPLIRQVSRFRLHQFLDLLPTFEPLQVICHTGYDPHHHRSHQQLWLERSLAVWEPLVRRAELMKIPLLLENVWEHNPEVFSSLFSRIPSPYFGFCLDVGHRNAFARSPQQEWLTALSDFLQEIHLHDNDGSQDAHQPIGSGSIDFAALFRFLQAKRLTPVITIEPHRREHLFPFLFGLQAVCGETQWAIDGRSC